MARRPRAVPRHSASRRLTDQDWITILAALARDQSSNGRRLWKDLMERSKPGRQVRLLRLIHRSCPTLEQMRRAMKVSRRTVFRYLSSLHEYGTEIGVDGDSRYVLKRVPRTLERLL